MNIHEYHLLSDVERRALKVAFLLGQGMTETDIGYLLFPDDRPETYRPKITAAKQIAMKKGWVEIRFAEELFDEMPMNELREEFHHRDYVELETELRNESGGFLRELRVFHSGSIENPGDDKDEWDEQLKLFAKNAASSVLKQLRKSKSGIGVGWGATVAYAIEALSKRASESARPRRNGQKRIEVVPTAGDPLGKARAGLEISSTSLARRLSYILNPAGKEHALSLENILSVLPARYKDKAKREVFMEGIRDMGSYRMIFGDPAQPANTPLIGKVDTILTSAGAFHNWHTFANELINTGRIPIGDLTKLAIGDIGGVLILRDGLENNKAAKAEFEQICSLWTGIELADYKRIAQKAAECTDPDGPAGCVLVALGANKGEIVLDLAIRIRVVNSLLINEALAKELKRLLKQRKRQVATGTGGK